MNSLFAKKLRRMKPPAVIRKHFFGNEDADQMPLERITAFQQEVLPLIIARAYEHSPFYHQKMEEAGVSPERIRSLADLALLPFTTKDELRGRPWDIPACDREEIALIQVSTGTTGGEEIYLMYTWRDYYLSDLAPGYGSLVPVVRGDICFNALPYEMSSAGLSFHKIFMDGCRATVIPAGKGGAYSTPAKSVKLLQDLRPTILITTPSWAMTLAEEAAAQNFNLHSLPLKKIWLTGEGCSPACRSRVEKIWGVVADFYYGSLECGCIGIECDAQAGYHIPLPHIALEITDPETGRVLEPGEVGEITVTTLLRFDTPLIRYRTRDLGFIDPDPCLCGVKLPKLHLRGRVNDQLEINGRSYSPFYLEEFLLRQPEVGNWFQFVLDPADTTRLLIRCEPAAGISVSPELVESIAGKFEYGSGAPCELQFVDHIPRPQGKAPRVLHLPAKE